MVLLWLLCLALGGTAAPASAADDPFEGGIHETITWEATRSERRGEGLFLHQSSSDHAASRLLVLTPGGERFVITSRTLPLKGTDVITIRDDATGWWMAVHKDYRLVGVHLRDFFYKAMDLKENLDGKPLSMRLVTSGGLDFEAEVQAAGHPELTHAAFVAALREAGLAERLAEQIPPELRDGLPFLGMALSREMYPRHRVWEVLSAVAPTDETFRKADWREVRGNPKAGLGISSPDLLELTAGFRSVENADPFTDVAPERR